MATIYCEAEFNYATAAPAADGGRGAERATVTQPVRDGRASAGQLSIEANGFELMTHRSEVTDWRNETHLASVHSPEIDALARSVTGCDTVVVYPQIVRSPQSAAAVADYAPITFVHSDFSADYRPMTYEPHRPYREFIQPLLDRVGLTQDDLRTAQRMMMVQFWRNIGSTTPDYPLAVCDSRSVDPSRVLNFVVDNYGGRRIEFELTTWSAPPADQPDHWYTFPNMDIDEVIAFRTYDSKCVDEGRPLWTPHSAFRDPHVGDNIADRRESVEMRALCLWH